MAKKTVRDIALTLLLRIEKEGGFSHLILSEAIRRQKIDPRDEKLLTELVYGTMERKITLDYYVQPFLKRPEKLADWVHILLRLSVFQFVFLDKIPIYAVINEAVQIAKYRGHKGIASLVNGVLRNVERKGVPSLDMIKDPVERLAVQTSHPIWLVERWIKDYGEAVATAICKANNTKKPINVRINRLRTTCGEMMPLLEQENMQVRQSELVKDAILIEKGNILKTSFIEDGFVTIQDQSSMLAASILEVEPGMTVLDPCSAPGGKATYLGELMENEGVVHAFDLHKNKINLIKRNAARLGLTNIQAQAKDARTLSENYAPESFDRILIDAPCSGFGVIRSKPDIKYTKQPADLAHLQKIQLAILANVCALLKPTGKLVYSTCTMNKVENEQVVQTFLENHPAFQVDASFLQEMKLLVKDMGKVGPYGLQIFPQSFGSDGFFMTRLTIRNS
jgi:16S rRNA (cytosine967-C5)-methyltransferase